MKEVEVCQIDIPRSLDMSKEPSYAMYDDLERYIGLSETTIAWDYFWEVMELCNANGRKDWGKPSLKELMLEAVPAKHRKDIQVLFDLLEAIEEKAHAEVFITGSQGSD